MPSIRWYEYIGMCAVLPASLIGSMWLLGWLTNSDPLIDEIWRLRGKNSAMRERLDQLEGERTDSASLRRVPPPCDRRRASLREAQAPSQ